MTQASNTTPFVRTFSAMTTQCELQFYHPDDGVCQKAVKDIGRELTRLIDKYNFHDPKSWLNRIINNRKSDAVKLDEESVDIFRLVRTHAEKTQGAFDITTGTFFHHLSEAKDMDTVKRIYEQFLPWTGLESWRLDGDMLYFAAPETRFDLGGVIKEYAVDQSCFIARQHGIKAGIVNYGGDLRSWGRKPDQEAFSVMISDPRDDEKIGFALRLYNHALTTSGHAARNRSLKDGLLSHIRNSGHRKSRYVSATVVGEETLVCGIYSTSLLVDDGISLPPKYHAYCVDQEYVLHLMEDEQKQ